MISRILRTFNKKTPTKKSTFLKLQQVYRPKPLPHFFCDLYQANFMIDCDHFNAASVQLELAQHPQFRESKSYINKLKAKDAHRFISMTKRKTIHGGDLLLPYTIYESSHWETLKEFALSAQLSIGCLELINDSTCLRIVRGDQAIFLLDTNDIKPSKFLFKNRIERAS